MVVEGIADSSEKEKKKAIQETNRHTNNPKRQKELKPFNKGNEIQVMLMQRTLKPTDVHPTAWVPFPSTKQQAVRVADGLCVPFVGCTPWCSDTSAA